MKKKTIYPLIFGIIFIGNVSRAQQSNELNTQQLNGYFEDLSMALKYPKKVKHLNLTHGSLSIFPTEILDMPNLEILDLSHNELKTLPDDIDKLDKLKLLYLNNNKIEVLPQIFREMSNLTTLYIQQNPINENGNLLDLIPLEIIKLESGNSSTIQPKSAMTQKN